MSIPLSGDKRVLAIDPTTRGFGFAVMEGPERLIDWGVKGGKKKRATCLGLVSDLVNQYQPEAIAVEDFSGNGSKHCPEVQGLVSRIKKLARQRKIRIRNFSRSEVRKVFSSEEALTKHQISAAIARRLPELAPRLPPFRKPWMSEDYRMTIFDAVSFALTFFYFEKKK